MYAWCTLLINMIMRGFFCFRYIENETMSVSHSILQSLIQPHFMLDSFTHYRTMDIQRKLFQNNGN